MLLRLSTGVELKCVFHSRGTRGKDDRQRATLPRRPSTNEQRQSFYTRHAFAADEEAQPIRYRYRYPAVGRLSYMSMTAEVTLYD